MLAVPLMRLVKLPGSLPKVIRAVWLMDTAEQGSVK